MGGDLRMRGMDGIEAIRRMRQAPNGSSRAANFGADFFMRKPYDYGELLDEISRVLVR